MRDEILRAPVGEVLYKLTLPMVIGIVAVFFFNLVDTYFIGLLGTQSLAAVSFTMPVAMVVMNLAIGLGIAASALVATSIGGNDQRQAQHYVVATLLLAVFIGTVILCCGWYFNDQIFLLLGASEAILPEIWAYMQYWWPGAWMMVLMIVMNSCMRAVGNTKLPSMMMLISAILNAILDPILIFGLGPVPEMGIAGAALATTLCWSIVVVIMLLSLARIDLLQWAELTLNELTGIWQRLVKVGVPAVITNVLVPVASGFLLALVAPMGEEAVAAFGVGARIEPFAIVVVLALTSTIPTFVGQNFAADSHERIWAALNVAVKFIVLWQLVIWLLVMLVSPWLALIFTTEEAVKQGIVTYLSWMPVGYAGMGIVLCANAALNALQRTGVSMMVNLVRLVCFYVPFAWLGSVLYGYTGLLAGAAAGNVLAGLLVWWQIGQAQKAERFGVKNPLINA